MRITFARKISLLVVGLILVTGTLVTAVTAYQFREDLVREEIRSAYTVYLSVINYLTGHIKSHQGRYVDRILDFVLEERFLNAGVAALGDKTPRLTSLVIFSDSGNPLYAFSRSDRPFTDTLAPPSTEHRAFRISMNFREGWLRASGPVSPDGEVPGWMVMEMPTTILARIHALYLKAAGTLLVIGLIGTAVAVYATRRFVAPVQTLIGAAERIQAGDTSVRVDNDRADELGQMAKAFNQMVESISRRMTTMGRIHDWSLRLGKEMNLDRLYQSIAAMFMDIAGAGGVGVYHRPGSGAVRRLAVQGTAPLPNEARSLGALTPDHLEALRIGNALTDQGRPAEADLPGVLVLPLYQDDDGDGLLVLGPRPAGRGYDPELQSQLTNLAQSAGLLVENARLYEELKEQERIQQEMAWARDIQLSLLPRGAPRLTGYEMHGFSRPARVVGGDYYDYIAGHQPGICHLIIGDVSGKGMPAGLIMSVVRSLVHTYAEFRDTPAAILRDVNRILYEDLEPEMFVTASMLTVDADAHTLRMVRAGHEPALLVRGDGEVSRLHPRGTGLGLVDLPQYDEHAEEMVYRLAQGDVVVLFTDGVTEARNADGQEFGVERLTGCIKRHRHDPLPMLVDQIMRALREFTGGREQLDDITLVALRRSRS